MNRRSIPRCCVSVIARLAVPLLFLVAFPVAAAGNPRDPAEIEKFLLEGEVLSVEDIGSGVTGSRKVILGLGQLRMKAAFKTLDRHDVGLTTFEDGTKEVGFSDSYRYERAAYLLDRRLGLNMVPVTVLREIAGETGALIEWIPGAINEGERRVRDGATSEGLRRQQELMEVFDALICNVDRHAGNQLVTQDSRLHLIDHSRSFRIRRALTRRFKALPLRVTPEMLHGLESLQSEELDELLEGLLTRAQIKAILHRRDRILDKINRDREEYGDSYIIQPIEESDEPPSGTGSNGP